MMNKRGSSSVEEVMILVLLIAFLVVVILILMSVFHFSLFGAGQVVPRLTTQPAPCSISFINFSTSGRSGSNCCFEISASSGSPGIIYKIFSNDSDVGEIGSYAVGIGAYSQNVTINSRAGAGTQYFKFICNTTGSNSSTNGYYYSAGGAAQILIGCGNGLGGVSGAITPQVGNCP